MSNRLSRLLFTALFGVGLFFLFFILFTPTTFAANIIEYKDTISDSGPSQWANHTIAFTLLTDVSAGGYIDIIVPSGFTVLSSSTFSFRDVELYVNGSARTASGTPTLVYDGVAITPGSPGSIRYTLNSTSGLSSGDKLEIRIGNHTSTAKGVTYAYSTSTGTTTVAADVEPIKNSSVLGKHDMKVRVYDGGQVANADPVIFLIEKVTLGPVDTTETIPPYRFNGAPTSTVGGTTLSVEISLETDEFAICRYERTAGVDFGTMSNTFSNTGLIFHSTVVTVTPGNVEYFYVRCIDDEDNFNIDDFIIFFSVTDTPAGTANTEGDVSGNGSGTGDSGTGSGEGSGGTVGSSDGQADTTGSNSGGGGSGGGSGTSGAGDDGTEFGGGFEVDDDAYRSGVGRVIITGYAFPSSQVVALVDGKIAALETANSSGSYTVTLPDIARGVYTFGIFAVDKNDVRSSTFSTSFTVTGSLTTALSNINVMPSISVTPDPVNIGSTVTWSGYSIPNATINIQNMKDGSSQTLKSFTTTSNSSGAWSLQQSTAGFARGTYKVRAQAVRSSDNIQTSYSDYTFYGVGEQATGQLNADLNRDGSVNLIDFSILLFWWGGDGGDSDPPADINQDGNVSLTDFSILLFQWTG